MAIRISTLLKICIVLVLVMVLGGVMLFVLARERTPAPGSVRDEAQMAGLTTEAFRAADEDYFRDMDRVASSDGPKVVELTPEDVQARNSWHVWTAGSD